LQPWVEIDESGLPPWEEGHQIIYSYRVLLVCNTCGHAQLECHSHDCWSHDEDWDMYWWYVLAPAGVARLRQILATCLAPLDPACGCNVHVALRRCSERLYGGVRHVTSTRLAAGFAWLTLEEREGLPFLAVDESRPVCRAA
jgi:hypothetical protein